jgi:hypothetical protein
MNNVTAEKEKFRIRSRWKIAGWTESKKKGSRACFDDSKRSVKQKTFLIA